MHGNQNEDKAKEQRQTLTKHINSNINQLRENAELLTINDDNEERKQVERMAMNLTRTDTATKRENNEIWQKLCQLLYTQQTHNFPKGTKEKRKTK